MLLKGALEPSIHGLLWFYRDFDGIMMVFYGFYRDPNGIMMVFYRFYRDFNGIIIVFYGFDRDYFWDKDGCVWFSRFFLIG